MIISSIVAGWAAIDGVAFTTISGTSLIIDRVTINDAGWVAFTTVHDVTI